MTEVESSSMRQSKNKSRTIARKAIRRGELVRPNICELCGIQCKPEAHHPDYARPLTLLWLCKNCHSQTTRLRKQPALRSAPKDQLLQIRLSKRLLERLRKAAEKQERNVSDFVRLAALRAVEQIEQEKAA
jgi:Ribbon-helix-helix protein, copG family